MAIDIKDALYHFGMITGQVTNDELLGNIFANFCIGVNTHQQANTKQMKKQHKAL
jgi:hypothetical protein